jgi:hypothetical protein
MSVGSPPKIRRPGRALCLAASLCVASLFAAVLAGPASASQLIDRNATAVTLRVNADGEALVDYIVNGHERHVLAWGAVNALPPTRSGKQVAFSLDYSGGYGRYHQNYWQTFPRFCGRYDGPELSWFVAACKAPGGSYWALQRWQRGLPNYGMQPSRLQAAWELRLSHFTLASPLPALALYTDWAYAGRWAHLYGTYSYAGSGVHGFHSTSAGVPTDPFGRNIYVDTFDSRYPGGKGRWLRENSFLAHGPAGTFCYLLAPHGSHPDGTGTLYRATAIGPGVMPDRFWQGPGPGPYDAALDGQANAVQKSWSDRACYPH